MNNEAGQYLADAFTILQAAVSQAEQELAETNRRLERYRRAQATLTAAAQEHSPGAVTLALVEARAIVSGAGRRGPLEGLVDEAVGRLGYAMVEDRGAA